MKKQLIEATRLHLKSHINKHVVNLEVLLNNPITIPEHTDIMESIEKELGYISEYRDKLESLEQFFGDNNG